MFVLLTLPPRPVRIPLAGVDDSLRRRTLAGAFHVHTTRSDGHGDKAEAAAAAKQAGLAFIIFSDHGDGTRPPEPPAYIDGVLCMDAVEISTSGGHYVAVDMRPSPYPLGGEPAAVVEDVARLGGFGIVAHPDHPKPELAWHAWDAPADGFEWLNLDVAWRDEPFLRLARVLLAYPFRPAAAIAQVLDRPDAALSRLAGEARPSIALGAADAHGGSRLGSNEHHSSLLAIGPSYAASFAAMSNRVILPEVPSGDPATDTALVLDAIRAGSVYTVVDAISPDVALAFSDGLPTVRSELPPGAQLMSSHDGSHLEIHMPGAPGSPAVPWVFANGLRGAEPPQPLLLDELHVTESLGLGAWRIEKDPASTAQLKADRIGAALRYDLAASGAPSPFVALAADIPNVPPVHALLFTARADAPMRVSVQLRFAPEGQRWRTSVYLDETERDILVPLERMVPAEGREAAMPPLTQGRSLLFVVDRVNARPGDAGGFSIGSVRGVQ